MSSSKRIILDILVEKDDDLSILMATINDDYVNGMENMRVDAQIEAISTITRVPLNELCKFFNSNTDSSFEGGVKLYSFTPTSLRIMDFLIY